MNEHVVNRKWLQDGFRIFPTREKWVSRVDVAEKQTQKFIPNGGTVVANGGTVVASAGRVGGMRGAARLRQKLSEFDRF